MNDRERKQLDSIIAHETALARKKLGERVETMFRRQNASGMLASGNTIHLAVKECEEEAGTLLNSLITSAQRTHADIVAFAAVEAAIRAFIQECRKKMKIALGHVVREPSPQTEAAAWKLFEEKLSTIESALSIARFEFEEPGPATAPVASQRKNVGRLPSAFWDDLWAAMAAGLYDGSLQPKSQADVERMMADWIAENKHSAATSTIRLRAEKLWPLIAPDRT
jgi:hypothetical protein